MSDPRTFGTVGCCLAVLMLQCDPGAAATSGGVDSTFDVGGGNRGGFDREVTALAVQPDGRIIAAGVFTKLDAADQWGLVRLNGDGSLDPTLDAGSGVDRLTEAAVLQSDGRLLLGGWSMTYNGAAVPYLVRVEPNGALSTGFSPLPNHYLTDCLLQPDGRIVFCGYFTSVGGVPRAYVARLEADGSLDSTFNPGVGPDSYVYALALQPDGRIFIAGAFSNVGGSPRNRVARLLADGSLDATFDAGQGVNEAIYDIELQPDGRLLLGGWFDQIDGQEQWFLGRLHPDGTRDAAFTPQIDPAFGQVLSVKAQPNGRVLAAGTFWSVGGVSRRCVARFLSDGTLDASFDPGLGPEKDPKSTYQDPVIREMALQADGRILACGEFIKFDGVSINRLVRLTGDSGGSVEWEQAVANIEETATQVELALTRVGSTAGPVSVDVGVLSSGGAVVGHDFVLESSTVVFAAGEMRRTLKITVPPGGMTDQDAEVLLALGNPLGGILLGTTQQVRVSIASRAGGEVVQPQFTAIERLDSGVLRLTVDAPSPGDYVLQGSTDSQQWTDETTESGPGPLLYEVTSTAGSAGRFYRIKR